MKFGLIGKSLKHSFSKNYFDSKFSTLNLNHSYHLFELISIDQISSLLLDDELVGLNVTVPYKSEVLEYVDELSPEVKTIGAANVLVKNQNQWIAHNTDVIGFEKSIFHFIPNLTNQKVLVIGNGGSAKAVTFILKKHNIMHVIIARNPKNSSEIPFSQFSQWACDCKVWINTTPVGMYPNDHESLDIDFDLLSENHYLYDLIYNPEVTNFLKEGIKRGAKIRNGLEMLYLQAEGAWEIWSSVL